MPLFGERPRRLIAAGVLRAERFVRWGFLIQRMASIQENAYFALVVSLIAKMMP
jgi:hypothetical protein